MESSAKSIEELLEEGKVLMIKPDGYSMYPMLVPGRDEVFIKKAETDKIKRGDVVLYRRKNGILILHRLHHKRKDGFYLAGDNQVKMEGPLKEEQVIGVLEGFMHNGKYISTDNILYRILSGIWLLMRPVRRPFQLTAAWIKSKLIH